MNRGTVLHENPPTGNILVIDDDGEILSRRVSQVYGRALLGAMALRMNKLRSRDLHKSFLSHHESLTLNNIRRTAEMVAPGDNFMFINENREILSCRINPQYGVALLENLQQTPEEANQVLPHSQASGNSNYDTTTKSYQHAHEELHQPWAEASSSSPTTSMTTASIVGILPDPILSSTNRQPYDRAWMAKYNINKDCLNGYTSKHKLDILLRYGAVKVGDRLCVAYHPDSGPVVKYGEVLQIPKKGRLDLRIATARADFDGILHDCKSPKEIISGMDKEFQLERNSKISEAWKMVGVVAGDGEEVGSLWKVRQAYQVFTDEMAEWGARNRQSSP